MASSTKLPALLSIILLLVVLIKPGLAEVILIELRLLLRLKATRLELVVVPLNSLPLLRLGLVAWLLSLLLRLLG